MLGDKLQVNVHKKHKMTCVDMCGVEESVSPVT